MPFESAVKAHNPVTRPFITRVLETYTSDNQVLRRFDEWVGQALAERGIQVVDPVKVAEGLAWMKDRQSFNWKRFATNLGADSLVFISLFSWRPAVPLARKHPGDPYRYSGYSYDQFY